MRNRKPETRNEKQVNVRSASLAAFTIRRFRISGFLFPVSHWPRLQIRSIFATTCFITSSAPPPMAARRESTKARPAAFSYM